MPGRPGKAGDTPEMTASDPTPPLEAELLPPPDTLYADVNDLLRKRRLGLRFGEGLEHAFRRQHARESAAVFRNVVFYVILLYCALGLGIVCLVPWHALDLWPFGYLGVGLIILTAAMLSRTKQFDRNYEWQVAGLASIGMALLVALPFLIRDPLMRQLAMIGVIHAVVVVGAVLGLRFFPALVAMLGGGMTGLLIAGIAGYSPDWLMVHRTFSGGVLIGGFLAWLAEKRSRHVFLQQHLLAMEKARSDALAEQMRDMSRHDTLTGLANRRYFDEVLDHEWLRCRRDGAFLSLLFIDVDFFKNFNDHYGHQHGDECLRQVAGALRGFARRPGDFAARYGGEEFVLLYPQTGPDTAVHLAGEILKAVSDLKIKHRFSSVADHVTISIGVTSMAPGPGAEPEHLVRGADHALYLAKNNGRNRFFFGVGSNFQGPHGGEFNLST